MAAIDYKVVLTAIFRTLFIITNNLYAIPAYVVWTTLLLPLKYYSADLFWYIEGHLFHWLLRMVSNWSWTAGYTVFEVGDDVSECLGEECLVISNHQSTGDVPILMFSLTDKKGVANNMMWIMDTLFKYTNFGIVSQIHQDFFITQGKETRQQQLIDLENHMKKLSHEKSKNKWIVLFPEGGFLRKRRESSKRFAKSNGYPEVHNVTLPRTGAMEVIINSYNDTAISNQNGYTLTNGNSQTSKHQRRIKWIIDITIGYPEGKPLDAFCVLFGHRPPCKTTLLYRRYPIENVPREGNEMLMWLFKIYEEKNRFLEHFYKTGSFPDEACTSAYCMKTRERQVKINIWTQLAIHIFYLLSTYIQIQALWYIVSLVW